MLLCFTCRYLLLLCDDVLRIDVLLSPQFENVSLVISHLPLDGILENKLQTACYHKKKVQLCQWILYSNLLHRHICLDCCLLRYVVSECRSQNFVKRHFIEYLLDLFRVGHCELSLKAIRWSLTIQWAHLIMQ